MVHPEVCLEAHRRTAMPKKRHKPEEIVAKLRQVDVMVAQGQSVAGAVRAIGVTEVTYYLYGRLSRCKQNRLRSRSFIEPVLTLRWRERADLSDHSISDAARAAKRPATAE